MRLWKTAGRLLQRGHKEQVHRFAVAGAPDCGRNDRISSGGGSRFPSATLRAGSRSLSPVSPAPKRLGMTKLFLMRALRGAEAPLFHGCLCLPFLPMATVPAKAGWYLGVKS